MSCHICHHACFTAPAPPNDPATRARASWPDAIPAGPVQPKYHLCCDSLMQHAMLAEQASGSDCLIPRSRNACKTNVQTALPGTAKILAFCSWRGSTAISRRSSQRPKCVNGRKVFMRQVLFGRAPAWPSRSIGPWRHQQTEANSGVPGEGGSFK